MAHRWHARVVGLASQHADAAEHARDDKRCLSRVCPTQQVDKTLGKTRGVVQLLLEAELLEKVKLLLRVQKLHQKMVRLKKMKKLKRMTNLKMVLQIKKPKKKSQLKKNN